jgi:hypothetical protein
MLEYGDTFGPWEAGPDGCVLYGVIMGPGNPFYDRPAWQKFLAERGAVELPVPPIELPLWNDALNVLPGPLDE